jgi:hypothetical protein
VQKLILSLSIFSLLFGAVALGQSRLKTANSVNIIEGFIVETVVLADDASQIFLEFIKGDRVAKALDGQIYDGEILPPFQIDAPARAPRARMRELLSFEVISDSSEELELIDQFAALHSKDRLRQSLKNQAGQRRQGAQIITVFSPEEQLNRPALWYYNVNNANTPWTRLGGIVGEAPAGESIVFSAYLYGTGIFTIWDENPMPDFQPSFTNDEIELAEPSPFPSVTENSMDDVALTDEFIQELGSLDSEINLEPGEILNNENETLLIPAIDNQDSSLNLLPALPEEAATNPNMLLSAPTPSDLIPAVQQTPRSNNSNASNSVISGYFQNNVLALTTEEINAIGNPANEIIMGFEVRQGINSNRNTITGAPLEDEAKAELLAQVDFQILFAELSEIVLESIENQITLANGLTSNAEGTLWADTELPNAYKVLNKIDEINDWQSANPLVYQNELNRPEFKNRIDLIPKFEAHYQGYFNLPVRSGASLQANAFQDFGTQEGALPVAGGVRFPWFLLVVFGIIGFSIYTLRQKPY